MSHKHTHGFTLIELLVVISIIALLVSILLPALSSSRKAALAVQCGSNFRQVAIADATYMADSDEFHVPMAETYNRAANYWTQVLASPRWFHHLENYSETYEIFNCPVRSERDPLATVVNADTPSSDGTWTVVRGRSQAGATANTAYNLFVGGVLNTTTGLPGWQPASKVTMRRDSALDRYLASSGEGVQRGDVLTFMDGRFFVLNASSGVYTDESQLRSTSRLIHPDETMNAAYLDGHVSRLRITDLRGIDNWDYNHIPSSTSY